MNPNTKGNGNLVAYGCANTSVADIGGGIVSDTSDFVSRNSLV